jgi:putative DNA methylase
MSLEPFSWKDRPALIEKLFPVQKLSVESYKEQSAVQSKTLTALGSYWKGRKPLILNKACILGCLLPATDNPLKDLEIFELLMGMDKDSLKKRVEGKNDKASKDFLANESWHSNVVTYKEWVSLGLRPEECGMLLQARKWKLVNDYLGTSSNSISNFIEEIGIARFGRKPKVGDTFSGSGQIAFEAARIGCNVVASDLNPIASMLTWASINIVGSDANTKKDISEEQRKIVQKVKEVIDSLEIETDNNGSIPKAYLYCLEVKCPESGWMVPILPKTLLSKKAKTYVKLVPDPNNKRYEMVVLKAASSADLDSKISYTIKNGSLVHSPEQGVEYRVKISTVRGDHSENGKKRNNLRMWEISDFIPRKSDIYQERLYCVQWMRPKAGGKGFDSYFMSVSDDDLKREQIVIDFLEKNISDWQEKGWLPDMVIESGYNTDQPIRERGWTHWHHLFCPRQLLMLGLCNKYIHESTNPEALTVFFARLLDWSSKLCRFGTGAARESIAQTFYNQALNTMYNYGVRPFLFASTYLTETPKSYLINNEGIKVLNQPADNISELIDIYVTDPPYGDAIKYEEITEFFIAWLRKNPPLEFANWTWDSRRAIAVTGEDENFRQSMIKAYKAMADHMPVNGMQILMFTHQSGSIWADMANIIWASGLRVSAAWYVVTETDAALKDGSYISGTILLVLRKRSERLETFRDDLAWEIKDHVKEQMDSLTGLDKSVREQNSEGLYNDADLQMAGYAAALKVLTTYSVIDGKDMEVEAKAPRQKGVKSFVDQMIEFAIQNTVEYLVPSSFDKDEWKKLSAIERYYLKMIDMEAQGEKSLDNYQNFAKAFKIHHFENLMGVSRANSSRLKVAAEFKSSLMSGGAEIAGSLLRSLLYAMWEAQKDIEMDEVLSHLMDNCGAQYLQSRHLLISMAQHIADRREGLKPIKLYETEASAARVLSEAIQGHRL